MNKRVIIISVSTITLLLFVIIVSYVITSNSNLVGKPNNDTHKIPLENTEEEIDVYVDKSEYKEINIDSQLATQILDFVPKYLQTIENKMSSEYVIYSAISKLEEKKVPTANYMIGEGEFAGYKFNVVEKEAKQIFGPDIELEKKDKYNLPIGYSSDNNVFCKYPMGFGSYEEYQVIKELKENDKTYKLTTYALNIDYDTEDLNNIYVSTKSTFKLYAQQEANYDIIKESMEKYSISGIEIDPTYIVNEYKDKLPLIEYELEKLDDRGIKYFVKNIKLIFD